MPSKTYGVDSVYIANTLLEKCFKKKLPITFGQLERATLRVEQLCMTNGDRHAISDYVYPAISDKVSTVVLTDLVTKFVPHAAGTPQVARPRRDSTLRQSLKQTVAEHRSMLAG